MADFDSASGRGLVGAAAQGMFGPVAVETEELEAVLGEFMFSEPEDQHSASADPSKMLPPSPMNMVDSQENRLSFPTAAALVPIGREHFSAATMPRCLRVPCPVRALAFEHAGRTTRVVTPGTLFGIQPETIQGLDFTAKTAAPPASREGNLLIRTSHRTRPHAPLDSPLSNPKTPAGFAPVRPQAVRFAGEQFPRCEVLSMRTPNLSEWSAGSFGWHRRTITCSIVKENQNRGL